MMTHKHSHSIDGATTHPRKAFRRAQKTKFKEEKKKGPPIARPTKPSSPFRFDSPLIRAFVDVVWHIAYTMRPYAVPGRSAPGYRSVCFNHR